MNTYEEFIIRNSTLMEYHGPGGVNDTLIVDHEDADDILDRNSSDVPARQSYIFAPAPGKEPPGGG